MTGSPPSPLGLQSIIIWAKKYCFYLGFQALRGKKLLKVHILVLKKKKGQVLRGISDILQRHLWGPPGAGIGSRTGAPSERAVGRCRGVSEPRALCRAANSATGGMPTGVPLGGQFSSSQSPRVRRVYSGQVRPTLKQPGPKSVIFMEKIAKLFISSNNQMIGLSPAYPAMLF